VRSLLTITTVVQDEEKVNAKDIVQENSEIATNDNDSGDSVESSGTVLVDVIKVKKDSLVVYCEACNDLHVIDKKDVKWFNGSRTKPTVKPHITFESDLGTCQFFITDGEFRYSNKCTHEFAGKRIKMDII